MGAILYSAITWSLLLAFGALPGPASPSDEVPVLCHRLERDMDRVRAQLRQGNSTRQRARARSRMHKLKSRYYRRCRAVDR